MIDFNAQTDMARVMSMTLNTVLPEVVEDRQLNPPDVPDENPVSDQAVTALVEKLKRDPDQIEDLCVDICDDRHFANIITTCWEDEALAGGMLKVLASELLISKAKEVLRNPAFAREQAE